MYKKVNLPIHNQIISLLKEPILILDPNGTILSGNKAAFQILQLQNQTTESLSISSFIDFELIKQSDETHIVMEQFNQSGKLLEVRSVLLDNYYYCIIFNQLSLQEQTDEIKQFLNEVAAPSTEGVLMYGEKNILDCDSVFADMFGYTPEELQGKPISDIINLKNKNSTKTEESHLQNGNQFELTGIRKDGKKIYIDLIEYPYTSHGKIIRIASVKNITERVENENRIEYMAFYDELTDLPNRNFFHKVLKEAIRESKFNNEGLAVFFVDLDYFKEINDTLGYSFGDKLLKAFGNKLKAFLETDTFIARMSGDEFLILQRNITSKDTAVLLAEQLIKEFESPIKIGEYEIFTSVSIGISLYPENGETANDLIKHADSAMYVIKEKHRNNYNLFESSISENFKMMLTMETELRKALKEKQFELHYQPQKNLSSGKVVGLEALIRWNHPEKGYISPGDFIPLAEKTGLIIEIGDWVLYEACRQNKEWQDAGYEPVTVSVNLSAKQFHQRNLVDKVKQVLNKTGLEPHYLDLEITESMAMSNEEDILKTLHDLRDLGVFVSIDDFGTGYSSFKYLSIFPVTKLKIDKMFLNDAQKENKAIVKSIIHMSHSLDMKVIAEGVETVDQLLFLAGVECDEMQGFYFSKPLPPEKLNNFFIEV
ncbi:GGDEF and EAL domain-containing protein [Ornithinibacillus halophilus]|uniref:PAS domain S-box-containing protein/diguanylate cyclase (GGDEF) domain-containing protein n=1 Tax=Ornithinibacillus halophilus TaxID=930117 RepID=A0A1M5I8U9_9BACI|nr:GGDEF and EAL domain-containing protein [Ornithinibacillus halophilus]SHG24706.1 PAS domain S-box-containing protein/diguanylate cyclase (GGDEF) domain-containing protein [Ornithinibacillus halophilus]